METLNGKYRFTLSIMCVNNHERPLLSIKSVSGEKIDPLYIHNMELDDDDVERQVKQDVEKYNLDDEEFKIMYLVVKTVASIVYYELSPTPINGTRTITLDGQEFTVEIRKMLQPLFQNQTDTLLESLIPKPAKRLKPDMPTLFELCMFVCTNSMRRLAFTKIADSVMVLTSIKMGVNENV